MKKIFMNSWLKANNRKRTNETDNWYVRLANELSPTIETSLLFGKVNGEQRTQAAISLSLYMQDAVAQTGGWATFKEAYRKLYGEELPFYTISNDYVTDEINQEDIAFVLWTRLARPACHQTNDYTLQDPYDTELLRLAQALYEAMIPLFEEAPNVLSVLI